MGNRRFNRTYVLLSGVVFAAALGVHSPDPALAHLEGGEKTKPVLSIGAAGVTTITHADTLFAGQRIVPNSTISASVTLKNNSDETLLVAFELAQSPPTDTDLSQALTLQVRSATTTEKTNSAGCENQARSTVQLSPGESHAFIFSAALADLSEKTAQGETAPLEIRTFATADLSAHACDTTIVSPGETGDRAVFAPTGAIAHSLVSTGQTTAAFATIHAAAFAACSALSGGLLIALRRRARRTE